MRRGFSFSEKRRLLERCRYMPILLILFVITLAISMWGRKRFQRIYDEELENTIGSRITGAELAGKMLETKGITDIKIVKGRGLLRDFYDPGKRRLTLSPQHFGGSSFSGLGVVAHEAGHIIQHSEGYRPLSWRVSVVKGTAFLSLPLLVFGFFCVAFGMKSIGLLSLTIAWPLLALSNILTIPVELDASERAKKRLHDLQVFRNLDERVGVERVMDAASANYIDGIFIALSWIRSLIRIG